MNYSTNFRGLPFNEEIQSHKLGYLFILTYRLCSRDLAWAGVFARSSRSAVYVVYFS